MPETEEGGIRSSPPPLLSPSSLINEQSVKNFIGSYLLSQHICPPLPCFSQPCNHLLSVLSRHPAPSLPLCPCIALPSISLSLCVFLLPSSLLCFITSIFPFLSLWHFFPSYPSLHSCRPLSMRPFETSIEGVGEHLMCLVQKTRQFIVTFTASVPTHWHSSVQRLLMRSGMYGMIYLQRQGLRYHYFLWADEGRYAACLQDKKALWKADMASDFSLLSFTLHSEPYLCLHRNTIMLHIMNKTKGFEIFGLAVTMEVCYCIVQLYRKWMINVKACIQHIFLGILVNLVLR